MQHGGNVELPGLQKELQDQLILRIVSAITQWFLGDYRPQRKKLPLARMQIF